MTLDTWELALVIGSGTLALLMCAYSVYILMRRRRAATPLTRVVVEEGRGKTESKSAAKTESTSAAKTESKTTNAKPADNGGTHTDVLAVKIQPNKYAVTCPGGGKACIGSRKEGVQTITQPNQLPAPKIRRDSAPSRISSGRSNAPRV